MAHLLVNLTRRLAGGLKGFVVFSCFLTWITLCDALYRLANTFLPSRRSGRVIPSGQPGSSGVWPDFIPPRPGLKNRSPCPALNALANHGILPRNGKRITFKQMSHGIQHAFNLAPSLAQQLTASAFLLDQGRGWVNLYDLNALNVVQHDASFTRPDIALCPDQSFPHTDLVDQFLAEASDRKNLSIKDIVRYSEKRRAECQRTNGQYSLSWSFLHKFFGSGNCALMYSIFGGNVHDLRIWLAEERFPDGWEPRNRERFGFTIIQAQIVSLLIELSIREE